MDERRAHRIAAFRDAVSDRLSRLGVSWIQVESGVSPPNTLNEMLRELHALKGEAAVLGFVAATELIHALEAAVHQGSSADGDAVLRAFDVLGELLQGEPSAAAPATLRPLLEQLAGPPETASTAGTPTTPGPAPAAPSPAPTPTVLAAAVVERGAGGLPLPPDTAAQPSTRGARLTLQPSSNDASTSRSTRRDVGLRIAAGQLDRMRDAIGDLFTLRVRLAQLADQLHDIRQSTDVGGGLKKSEAQLRDDVLVLATLLGSLEETVRELRMVPLGMVLERLPRIVRDLGRDLGKMVSVELEGESAAVDRDVIEAIEHALLHLVRNAVDHGLESSERRIAAGKPAQGTLRIAAQVAGRHLHISVADDGGGIDVAAVRRVAVERGLVDAGSDASDELAMQWIMLPGFTTREHATLVSGRGVGLDAVHASVQALGGSLDVTSKRGLGTTFKLTIPISTAITSVLLFHVGTARYALPIGSIEDVVFADAYNFDDSLGGPVIAYRGRDVPIVGLGAVVGRPSEWTERPRFIIVRTGLGLVACSGSHGHEHRDVVLRPAGNLLSPREVATAAITLEGGEIALVLNPARLHAEARRIKPVSASRVKTVLVVDDSPIIRDLVAEVLRSHGLHVVEAADGAEALERLAMRTDIALVITDVEMPRMGGLELISRLRARPERRVPAIVVSTRDRDEDKQAAIGVGADAYLVKSDLTQDSLWTLIGRYVGASS